MIYRDLYSEEMQHRDQLRGGISIPIAVLTLLGGAITYLFRNLFFPPVTFLGWWLTFTLAGAIVAFGVSVVFLVLSYHGHTYERIPSPDQIRAYQDALRLHFGDTDPGPARAAATFENFLRDRYARAADRNMYTNLKRSAYSTVPMPL